MSSGMPSSSVSLSEVPPPEPTVRLPLLPPALMPPAPPAPPVVMPEEVDASFPLAEQAKLPAATHATKPRKRMRRTLSPPKKSGVEILLSANLLLGRATDWPGGAGRLAHGIWGSARQGGRCAGWFGFLGWGGGGSGGGFSAGAFVDGGGDGVARGCGRVWVAEARLSVHRSHWALCAGARGVWAGR